MGFAPFLLLFYPLQMGRWWQRGGETLADLWKKEGKKENTEEYVPGILDGPFSRGMSFSRDF